MDVHDRRKKEHIALSEALRMTRSMLWESCPGYDRKSRKLRRSHDQTPSKRPSILPKYPHISYIPRNSDYTPSSKEDQLWLSYGVSTSIGSSGTTPPVNGFGDRVAWSARHGEGYPGELSTRAGSLDKFLPVPNEVGTAKSSVWSSIRHKSGLDAISQLYAATARHRQVRGVVPPDCSFKPPPRVTLTDTKRETWLRDLAQACIPLRRLSRTIPHGVRGTFLLDQCLVKRVPISRAIWLIKCVGANEIRAFKRKGLGRDSLLDGELKWFREWTDNVSHFLRSMMDGSSGSHRIHRVNYTLRLMSALCSEGLIENSQYLSWLRSEILDCDPKLLPIWLLYMSTYIWARVQSRSLKMGSAAAVTKCLIAVQDRLQNQLDFFAACNRVSSSQTLLRRLLRIARRIEVAPNKLADLFLTRFGNASTLIIPATVPEGEHTLTLPETHDKIGNLKPSNTVLNMLDTSVGRSTLRELANQCLNEGFDHSTVIATTLKWSCSTDRFSGGRLYVAVRLFRIWIRQGMDVQQYLHDLLHSKTLLRGLCKFDFCRLFSELTYTGLFSVGAYLQWLVSHGFLSPDQSDDCEHSCAKLLLLQLPIQRLSRPIVHLRDSILRKMRALSTQEDGKMTRLADYIRYQFSGTRGEGWDRASEQLGDDIEMFSRADQAKCARSLYRMVYRSLKTTDNSSVPHEVYMDVPACEDHYSRYSVPLSALPSVFRILMIFKEYTVVGRLLLLTARAAPEEMLSTICDHANLHHTTMAMIGVLAPIYHAIFERCTNISKERPPEDMLLVSLRDLCQFCLDAPGANTLRLNTEMKKLNDHIGLTYPKVGKEHCCLCVSVNSALQNGSLAKLQVQDSHDLQEHFQRTIANSVPSHARLIRNMHICNNKDFGQSVTDWLSNIFRSEVKSTLSSIIVPLLCHKLASLTTIVQTALIVIAELPPEDRSQLAAEILAIISDAKRQYSEASLLYQYRLDSQRQECVEGAPIAVLRLTSHALNNTTSLNALERTTSSLRYLPLVKTAVTYYMLNNGDQPVLETQLLDMVGDILIEGFSVDAQCINSLATLRLIMETTSEFNFACHALMLRRLHDHLTKHTKSDQANILDCVIGPILSTPNLQTECQIMLLAALPGTLASEIRDYVTNSLLTELHAASDNFGASNLLTIQQLGYFFGTLSHLASSALTCSSSNSALKITESLVDSWSLHSCSSTVMSPFSQLQLIIYVLATSRIVLDETTDPSNFLSIIKHLFGYTWQSRSSLPRDLFDLTLSTCKSLYLPILNRDHMMLLGDHRVFVEMQDLFEAQRSGSIIDDEARIRLAQKPTLKMSDQALLDTMPLEYQKYDKKTWEHIPDASPVAAENDTCPSIDLFGANRAIFS